MVEDGTDPAELRSPPQTERERAGVYIGQNADRYLRLYDDMIAFEDEHGASDARTFRIGDADFFSLPILLVAPLWLVYRKL